MNRAHLYKQRNVCNSTVSRLVRAKIMKTQRKQQRDNEITCKRNENSLFNINNNETIDVKSNVKTCEAARIMKLQRWKAEREIKKQLEMKNKKPAFIVGIPHHHYFSPTKNDPPMPHCHSSRAKCSNENCKCNISISTTKPLTPITLKRLAAKHSMSKAPKYENNYNNSNKRYKKNQQNISNKESESFAPSNYQFKAPLGIDPLSNISSIHHTIPKESKLINPELPMNRELKLAAKIQSDNQYQNRDIRKTEEFVCRSTNIRVFDDTSSIEEKNCIDNNNTYIIYPNSSSTRGVDDKRRISPPIIAIIPPTPLVNRTSLKRNRGRRWSASSSVENYLSVFNVKVLCNRTVVLDRTPLRKRFSSLSGDNNCISSANSVGNFNNVGYDDIDKENNLDHSVAADCNGIVTPRQQNNEIPCNICFRRDYYRDVPSLSGLDDL